MNILQKNEIDRIRKRMKKLAKEHEECASDKGHREADLLLTQLVEIYGHEDITDDFWNIEKWYS